MKYVAYIFSFDNVTQPRKIRIFLHFLKDDLFDRL